MALGISENLARFSVDDRVVPRRDSVSSDDLNAAAGFNGAGGNRPKAGFGEDTLSISGAALKTISRTIQGAKELVPSAEELREALKARREELAAQFERPAFENSGQTQPREEILPPDQPESSPVLGRPEAAPRASSLFDSQEETQPSFEVTSAPVTDEAVVPPPAAGVPQGPLSTNELNLLI